MRITEGALHAAVFLSARYITDRRLLDKAIDLIDEAASMIRLQIGSLPLPIDIKERELSSLIVKKEGLKREDTPSARTEAEKMQAQIAKVKEELALLRERWNQEKKLIEEVKEKKNALENLRFQEEEAERAADYNKVAELRYSILPKMKKELEEAQNKLLNLSNRLLQEEVDETLIAQIVAKWTGIPVNRMLEGEAQRLLNLEKAHHDVFNILLQIFDDGRLTDSKGRTVNCKNALFIMTSNLGSDLLLEQIRARATGWTKEAVLAIVEPVLKMHFRPEFLNRLDEILPFLPLQEQDMEKIAPIQLNHVADRLLERSIKLNWEKPVLAYLAQKGYDPLYGARPLKRLIQQEVVNLLSTAILKGEIKNEVHVTLILRKEKEEEMIHFKIGK